MGKESSTQHGFKVQFKILDKTTYLPAIKTFFENMVSNCKATQKSAIELKRSLHKLMVKYLNVKTLMRILREKKKGKSIPFTKIPLKPTKKTRENFENLQKASALAPNKTRIESDASNRNSNSNIEDVAEINVNADDINNGETLTEVDDDSEALRLFFLEKGHKALSNTEDEEEFIEASFLENSENKMENKNSTVAAHKARVNEEIKAASGEKGIFGAAKKFIGGLFGKTKAPKTPADLLIKRPNTTVPLTKEEIKDPVARLKYDKKEDELNNTEKDIKELQKKKKILKKI